VLGLLKLCRQNHLAYVTALTATNPNFYAKCSSLSVSSAVLRLNTTKNLTQYRAIIPVGSSRVGVQLAAGDFERGSITRGHPLPSPLQIKCSRFLQKM
jgi:hypothetical protein